MGQVLIFVKNLSLVIDWIEKDWSQSWTELLKTWIAEVFVIFNRKYKSRYIKRHDPLKKLRRGLPLQD